MSDPVADGRDALNQWFGYPWYDAETDGVRRIEASDPWDWSFSFPGSLLQWAAWIAIGLLLALAAYLLVRAFANREKRLAKKTAEPAGAADRVEALPAALAGTIGPMDYLAEAERCRQSGDYGRAVVYLYSHELWQLDCHGRIRLTRGKTNRQYLGEVAPSPALRGLVESTMLVFEDVFFGHHAIERPAFEAVWEKLGEFQTLVETGEGR